VTLSFFALAGSKFRIWKAKNPVRKSITNETAAICTFKRVSPVLLMLDTDSSSRYFWGAISRSSSCAYSVSSRSIFSLIGSTIFAEIMA
jgi:hypothetical protein